MSLLKVNTSNNRLTRKCMNDTISTNEGVIGDICIYVVVGQQHRLYAWPILKYETHVWYILYLGHFFFTVYTILNS